MFCEASDCDVMPRRLIQRLRLIQSNENEHKLQLSKLHNIYSNLILHSSMPFLSQCQCGICTFVKE